MSFAIKRLPSAGWPKMTCRDRWATPCRPHRCRQYRRLSLRLLVTDRRSIT